MSKTVRKSFAPKFTSTIAWETHAYLLLKAQKQKGQVDKKYLSFLSPKHHLFGELRKKTPGTFRHCVMVGNLAAVAAVKIGANPDLARAIGYYHDIGKTADPDLYFEARSANRSRSDELSLEDLAIILNHPERSKSILMAHGFPKEIFEAVAEHHGTAQTHVKIKPGIKFKAPPAYTCPLPSSKESAIVMLADRVQAAFERIKDGKKWPEYPSREYIRKIIEEINKELIEAEQYKKSGISLEELDAIVGSMMWGIFRYFNKLDLIRTPYAEDVVNPNMPHRIRSRTQRRPYSGIERRFSRSKE